MKGKLMIDIKKALEKSARNSIRINIDGKPLDKVGATKFGGKPDVPADFKWPYYEGEGYLDEAPKNRPLSFIAQFNLAEISKYDTDNLLPKTGLLSFFYDCDTMRWGYDPKDKGCARVYYFENVNALSHAEYPNNLDADFHFPELAISGRSEKSYQDFEDFIVQREKMAMEWDQFDEDLKSMGIEEPDDLDDLSKLLGWANVIQGNMTRECELIARRGYYLGDPDSWELVTPRDRQETEQWANRDWLLLFQLGTVETDGFELMFGDCGRIYFYIHRDDLAARNFDNVWLILQCG